LLLQFIDEQKGLSHNAFLKFAFQLPVPRKALKSEEWGWRYYPLSVEAAYAKKSEFSLKWQFDITYSSTCPCSAALAKQVVESEFINDFAHREVLKSSEVQQWLSEKALMATPHAQRSVAHIQLQMDTDSLLPSYIEIIDRVESALQTAVQTAVKREDEQEFARLNAANFMFCEDACRRIKNSLNNETRIKDFKIEVVHQESLHPHNAVSLAVKGVADGFIV
ncbi:MAG: GTP cyclohydrolase I FolE2, partial [Bdellovibrionales bacterium]|nr:GTP cyclohydrolase I FolE2 [Bdellovibrionales bacterium]